MIIDHKLFCRKTFQLLYRVHVAKTIVTILFYITSYKKIHQALGMPTDTDPNLA